MVTVGVVAGDATSDDTKKEVVSKATAGESAADKPLGEKLKSCEDVSVRFGVLVG